MNLKPSNFTIKNQRLVSLEYSLNPLFYPSGNVDLDVKAEPKISLSKDQRQATVSLTLKVFKKEEIETKPFYFIGIVDGLFEWNEALAENEAQLHTMLNQNAPAVLLSFLRPFIAQLTSMSRITPLILPLINFTDSK